jgi:hypothetical protein
MRSTFVTRASMNTTAADPSFRAIPDLVREHAAGRRWCKATKPSTTQRSMY